MWIIKRNDDALKHHGIKGQKWGVRNGPPYPLDGKNALFNSPSELSQFMKSNIKYSEFNKLQSPKETLEKGSGSCHDQVILELDQLRKMGYQPKAEFVIAYNPKTYQGGSTHSFVYYQDGDDIVWFENAWGGKEGLHKFKSLNKLENYITNNFGLNSEYSDISFSDFNESAHNCGESLQELVDICVE